MVLESPYRLYIEPLLEYIDEVHRQRQPNEVITVVVPEFVSHHWWSGLLHARAAVTLRAALLFHKDLVITSVPYQID